MAEKVKAYQVLDADLLTEEELKSGTKSAKFLSVETKERLILPSSPGLPAETGSIKIDTLDNRVKWIDGTGQVISSPSVIKTINLTNWLINWGANITTSLGKGSLAMKIPATQPAKIAALSIGTPIDIDTSSEASLVIFWSGNLVNNSNQAQLFLSCLFLGISESLVESKYALSNLIPVGGFIVAGNANSLHQYFYKIPGNLLIGKKLMVFNIIRNSPDSYSGDINILTIEFRYKSTTKADKNIFI